MRPAKTPTSNLTLILPGGGEERNLPAQVVGLYDPELGQSEDQAHEGVLTTWTTDDGERRALANGAAVEVILHAPKHEHPPISVAVTEPPADATLVAMLRKDHVDRAIGYLFVELAELMARGGEFPVAGATIMEIWHRALEETREGQPLDIGQRADAVVEKVEADLARRSKGNGNGEGAADA